MIYSKFPQRYLAAIVFCLILTLAALSGIFLIYLFNGNPTPLLFTANNNVAVANPPNYFSNNDDTFSSYQQSFFHKESQIQRESEDLHSIKDELVTLDNLMESTSSSISSEQHLSHSVKQPQKQRIANNHKSYHHIVINASSPVLANSDKLSVSDEHQQEMFSQQQTLHHQPHFLQRISDVTDSVEATAAENQDNVQLLSALTSIEKFQYQIPSSSSETSDTIYIDDFERQSNSEGANVDEKIGDDVPTNINTSRYVILHIHNLTGSIVEENIENSLPSTISSSLKSYTQNNSKVSKLNSKTRNKQQSNNHRPQLTELVKKKIKKHRLLNRFQHKNSNNDINNIVQMDSDKQIKNKMMQYSKHTLRKHQNFQNRENFYSAYGSKSKSINDVDNKRVNSGSGDFSSDDINDDDDSDDDYDIDADTADYIKRINIKLWRSMSNASGENSHSQRRIKQYKQQQHQLRQLQFMNNKQKKFRGFKNKQAVNSNSNSFYYKHQNLHDVANDVENFYSISSKIISNLSAPQLQQNKNAITSAIITINQDKDSSMMKGNINSSNINSGNNNQLAAATIENTVTRSNQGLLPSVYSFNNVSSNVSSQPFSSPTKRQQLSSRMTDLIVTAAEPIIRTASSGSTAAWLETRTRRIMGNVKKSDERSRQLLLCEEAGGGELCRMLFKGHLNE